MKKWMKLLFNVFLDFTKQTPPEGVMPMSIHKLGNSSVATVPTLYDLLLKKEKLRIKTTKR